MKKRTKRMETALKIIQTWAAMDHIDKRPRMLAMHEIEDIAMKALRKKAKPE